MKKFTKKLIATLIICIMVFPVALVNNVLAQRWDWNLTSLGEDQMMSFNYSISSAPVGNPQTYNAETEAVRQITIEVKMENIEFSSYAFRLGWDNEVVTLSRTEGNASQINTPTLDPNFFLTMPDDIIDTEYNTFEDYFGSYDVTQIEGNSVYIVGSIDSSICKPIYASSFPLLSSNYLNITSDGGISIAKITFQLRPGKSIHDVDLNTFFIQKTVAGAAQEGVQVIRKEVGLIDPIDTHELEDAEFAVFFGIRPIDYIEVDPTPQDIYEHNDPIDLVGGVLVIHYKDGGIETLPLMINRNDGIPETEPDWVLNTEAGIAIKTGYDIAKVGMTEVVITYEELEATFEITVEDPVVGIEIINKPNLTYDYGDNITLEDLIDLEILNVQVELTTKSGATDIVDLIIDLNEGAGEPDYIVNPDFIILSGEIARTLTGTDSREYAHEVVIEHISEATDSLFVKVEDWVSGISLIEPDKDTYYITDEGLDLTGGYVVLEWASKLTEGTLDTQILMTAEGVTVSGYKEENDLGEQTILVEYLTYSDTFSVNVLDSINGIELSDPVTLIWGDDLTEADIAGITVSRTYEGESEDLAPIPLTLDMIAGYVEGEEEDDYVVIDYQNKNQKSWTQTVAVTYSYVEDGKSLTQTTNLTINVINPVIEISLQPDNINLNWGQALNGAAITGFEYTEILKSGDTIDEIPLTIGMLGSYNPSGVTTGEYSSKSVTVTHPEEAGVIATLTVNIYDEIVSITMEEYPAETEYKYGQTVDLTGGELKVTRASGGYEIIDLPDVNVSTEIEVEEVVVDTAIINTEGSHTVTLTYKGLTTTFNVDVIEYGFIAGSIYATEYAAAREQDKQHNAKIYVFEADKINWTTVNYYRNTTQNFADLRTVINGEDLEDLILYIGETNPETGDFNIEVAPGTYDILIDKDGHMDYIVKGIVVTLLETSDVGLKRLDAGDINKDGKVDVVDIGWIKDAITGAYIVPIERKGAFDQNEDTSLSMLDVSIVKKYAAKAGLERNIDIWEIPTP